MSFTITLAGFAEDEENERAFLKKVREVAAMAESFGVITRFDADTEYHGAVNLVHAFPEGD